VERKGKGRVKIKSWDEHSSLLGLFISYEENIVLWIQPGAYSHFILFVTYEWAQLGRMLHYIKRESLWAQLGRMLHYIKRESLA
jgi:hypothetical protein